MTKHGQDLRDHFFFRIKDDRVQVRDYILAYSQLDLQIAGAQKKYLNLAILRICTHQFVTSTSPPGIPRAFDTLPFPGSRAFDKSAAGVGNLTDRTSDQTRAK